jgi:hypothetical protein
VTQTPRQIRQTQAWAFQRIRDHGLLSRLRFLVFEAIHNRQKDGWKDVTSGELDRIISRKLETWTRSASPRLSELVKLGVIEECGNRECTVTKQTVIAYRQTGKLPDKDGLKKPKRTRMDQARQLLLEVLDSCIPGKLRKEIIEFLKVGR